jgi:predicted deacylase
MTEHDFRWVPVSTLANGHEVALPLHRFTGKPGGPRLGIVSGVHGDEPLAVETVRRFLTELGRSELTGSVLAVPVANPYAHMALTRNTPVDGENLNRIFPGNAGGTITHQLAAKLVELFLGEVDYIVDFHSGGMTACVDYAYLSSDEELSKVYGADLLYRGPGYVGTFTSMFTEAGIPALVSEFGGASARIEHYLDKGVSGALNVARHLGMLPGEVTRTEGQRIISDLRVLSPKHGGIMLSEFPPDRLGAEIPQGTTLGRVVNPYTFEELEVLVAPFDPTLLVLTRPAYTNVAPGDYGFMVADGATAKPAD